MDWWWDNVPSRVVDCLRSPFGLDKYPCHYMGDVQTNTSRQCTWIISLTASIFILIRMISLDPVHPLLSPNISSSESKHNQSLLFIVPKVALIPELREMIFSRSYLLKEWWSGYLVMVAPATLHPPLVGVEQLNFSCTECCVHLKRGNAQSAQLCTDVCRCGFPPWAAHKGPSLRCPRAPLRCPSVPLGAPWLPLDPWPQPPHCHLLSGTCWQSQDSATSLISLKKHWDGSAMQVFQFCFFSSPWVDKPCLLQPSARSPSNHIVSESPSYHIRSYQRPESTLQGEILYWKYHKYRSD